MVYQAQYKELQAETQCKSETAETFATPTLIQEVMLLILLFN